MSIIHCSIERNKSVFLNRHHFLGENRPKRLAILKGLIKVSKVKPFDIVEKDMCVKSSNYSGCLKAHAFVGLDMLKYNQRKLVRNPSGNLSVI